MALDFITQSDFSGGINHKDDQSLIGDNELLDAEDCFVDARGLVRRRGPITWHGRTITNDELIAWTGQEEWNYESPRVICAGRHDYGDNQGIFFVTEQTQRSGTLYAGTPWSYQTLWFLPYVGNSPGPQAKSIFTSRWQRETRSNMGAVTPGITKAKQSATANAKYNQSLICCEGFSIAVGVQKNATYASGDVSSDPHRVNINNVAISGAGNWSFQVTLIAHGEASQGTSIGGQPIVRLLDDRYFRTAATVGGYHFLAGDSQMVQHFYWSAAEDCTSWSSKDFEYAPDLTSSPIRALVNLNESLCILKERSIFMLRVGASGPGGWSLAQRSGEIGTLDQRSVAHWRDSIIFADQRGIYSFDGYELTNISDKISGLWRPVFTGATPYTWDWAVVGFVFNDYYVITVSDGNGAFKIGFICHLPTLAWTRITAGSITATSPIPNDNNTVIGFHFPIDIPGYANTGAQMLLLNTMLDGGTGIDFRGDGPRLSVTTARIAANDRFRSKVWRRVEVAQKSSGNTGALQVECVTGTDPASTSYELVGTLPKSSDTKTRFRISKRSRALSVRIREVASGGSWLNSATISGIRLGLKQMRPSRDEGN